MTSFLPPRESLVVTSRLGTGNSRTFFLRCRGREIAAASRKIFSCIPDQLDQPKQKIFSCTGPIKPAKGKETRSMYSVSPICISFKKQVPPIRIKLWVSPHQRKSKSDTGMASVFSPFMGLAGPSRPIIGLKCAQSKMSQLSCSRAVKTRSECGLRLFLTSLKINGFPTAARDFKSCSESRLCS